MATGQKGRGRPSRHVKGAVVQNSTPTNSIPTKNSILKVVLVGLAIIDVVFTAALAYFLIHYIQQLKIIKHLNDFLDMAGETWQAICFQLIIATGLAIISGVGIEWFSKKKKIENKKWIYFAIELLFFLICFIMVGFVLKTKAILVKYQEETNVSQNIPVAIYQGANTPNTGQTLVETITYYFETDPYVSSEKIDAYRGVLKGTTQMEGNEIETAANIIYADMFTVYSMRTAVSEEKFRNYEERTKTANAYHEEYKKWYENQPNGSDSEVEQFVRLKRISILDQAIDCGIQADNAYEDAENRRMIAIRYIEQGDEYQAAGNMEMAEYCFEQSAIWGMKALYLAIPGTNITKMKQCLERLEIASKRMSGINGSKSDELSRVVNIYTRVVELRIAEL